MEQLTLEETVFFVECIVRIKILRTISLKKITEETLWFSDRFYLAEQLLADILFVGIGGGFNDIPKELEYVRKFVSE